MNKTKLDMRLKSVASFVRKGSVTADIGTDHGYVLSYLLENKIIEKAIAADLRVGPLNNARKTIENSGYTDKTEFVLSDGLENIKENSCEDIIIAGMGGILIAEILEKAPWIKNKSIRLILQPMTHAEILREFLFKNGFYIIDEVITTDGKRIYCTICAEFTGDITDYLRADTYFGKVINKKDKLSISYINKIFETVSKKYKFQKDAGIEDAEDLKGLIDEMNHLIGGQND